MTAPGQGRGGILRRWPLRVKLILIAWLAVIMALGISGPLIVVLVRSSLVDQVDIQLQQAASDVAQAAATELSTGEALPDQRLPSDYYVQFQIGSTRTSLKAGSAPTALGAVPNIPDLPPERVATGLGPATLDSVTGATKWRVVALPVAVHTGDGVGRGTVAVALPLSAVEATIGQITTVIIVAGIAVLLIASGVSWYAVDRALRPLRAVEGTALSIADGDLTQRVEVAPMSTEVGRLAYALNAMLTQIEHAFAARDVSQAQLRQFVADASHELRTPLAVLRGYAELYRQGGVPADEVGAVMGRIETEAQRLGDLVEDLLVLTRLDEGAEVAAGAPTSRGDVDIAELIDEAAADLRALDPKRDVQVINEFAEVVGGAIVPGAPDQMRQVLSNLVGNIVRYTPEGSAVEFWVGPRASGLAFEVRDAGPGISEAEAARMFDRFWRSDSGRSRAEGGAGLGLAIVAAIVGSHRGTVRAYPRDEGGLTVRVELPGA